MASSRKRLRSPDGESSGRLANVLVYGVILGYYIFIVVLVDALKLGASKGSDIFKNEAVQTTKAFRNYFFTVWNFGLQIMFLILAVADEASKLAKLTEIQRRCESYRQFLFAALVFPCSLLTMTIFWVIWHIDRELIFPRAVDDFYPPWLNHTLHTAIAIPLIVEVAIQVTNKNYRISRKYAAATIAIYCIVYQTLYMSMYFRHGIWLYPIYTVFTWAQRVAFVLMQFSLILFYQQIGISLLNSNESRKIKGT